MSRGKDGFGRWDGVCVCACLCVCVCASMREMTFTYEHQGLCE